MKYLKHFCRNSSGTALTETVLLVSMLGVGLITMVGTTTFHILSGSKEIEENYAIDNLALPSVPLMRTDISTGKAEFLDNIDPLAYQLEIDRLRTRLRDNEYPNTSKICFTHYTIQQTGSNCDGTPTAYLGTEDPVNGQCDFDPPSPLKEDCKGTLEKAYSQFRGCVTHAICVRTIHVPRPEAYVLRLGEMN